MRRKRWLIILLAVIAISALLAYFDIMSLAEQREWILWGSQVVWGWIQTPPFSSHFLLRLIVVAAIAELIALLFLLFSYNPRSKPTRLEKKSPTELREIGARYGYKISGKAGNTFGRVTTFALMEATPITVLVWQAVALFVGLVDYGSVPFIIRALEFATVLLISSAIIMWNLWYFKLYITVPTLYGLVMLNRITRTYHVLLPGGNIRYRWENHTSKDNLTLRSDIASRPAEFRTKDMVGVTFGNSLLRSRVYPPLLLVNAGHSLDTIEKASTDIIHSAMSDTILTKTIAETQKPETLVELQRSLLQAVEGRDARYLDVKESTFEEQYGVIAEVSPFGVPTPSEEYNQATEGRVTMNIYADTAQDMLNRLGDTQGSPGITKSYALDAAMINAKESVRKDIRQFGIDERVQQIIERIVDRVTGAFGGTVNPPPPATTPPNQPPRGSP